MTKSEKLKKKFSEYNSAHISISNTGRHLHVTVDKLTEEQAKLELCNLYDQIYKLQGTILDSNNLVESTISRTYLIK